MVLENSATLLTYLLGAVGIDLLFRWLAFERTESIAIDISIFSAVYSLIELLRAGPDQPPWKTPTLLGVVVLCGLAVLHRILASELKEKIEETYKALQENMPDPVNKDVINANIPVAKYAIVVALSTSWIRMGKTRRRKNIIEALRKADLDPKGILDLEKSFLLPKKLRRWMILVFFLGGLVSVAIPLAYTLFFLK